MGDLGSSGNRERRLIRLCTPSNQRDCHRAALPSGPEHCQADVRALHRDARSCSRRGSLSRTNCAGFWRRALRAGMTRAPAAMPRSEAPMVEGPGISKLTATALVAATLGNARGLLQQRMSQGPKRSA